MTRISTDKTQPATHSDLEHASLCSKAIFLVFIRENPCDPWSQMFLVFNFNYELVIGMIARGIYLPGGLLRLGFFSGSGAIWTFWNGRNRSAPSVTTCMPAAIPLAIT